MQPIAGLFGWLARKGLLYLLLVAALVAATLFTPWIESQWTRPGATRERLADLARIDAQLAGERRAAARDLRGSVERMRGAGVAAIDARLAEARRRLTRLERERPRAGVAARYLRGGAAMVLADQRRELDIAVARQEIASLTAARALAVADTDLVRYRDLAARARAADAEGRACALARGEAERFEREWLGSRQLLDRRRAATIAARRDQLCGRYQASRRGVQAEIAARGNAREARRRAERLLDLQARNADAAIAATAAPLDAQRREDQALLQGTFRRKAELFAERIDLGGKMRAAALALLAIIATPYLIRLFFFHILAPIAVRRPAIRLGVPGGRGAAMPPAERSTTSVGLRLAPGEELLVRQDYLQSLSQTGAKATRWLLDWRHPLSSIATGLIFLTRISGTSEVTTVSAVRDPFAEVTLLTLPEGGACVLQPRALAAVAQPIGRPLRITSHWRLLSLHAWLTLQLRYLVFHGPARLVLKGGRGVRVELAEAGRMFGQDQLVGFSAELAYSVTRTETFWPYFFGREPLFNDRVEAGDGVLIVEEAPLASRDGAGRGGLQGAFEAALKLVGL